MDKKNTLYGTPLCRSLSSADDDSVGPISQRRARLNEQQTVRDAQGRLRFHGAFTGGFSAGYYNTVDSVAGFQPRQFSTHRSDKRGSRGHSSRFTHAPEDYMDEEDLGEFGIAPRKIRVTKEYSGNEDTSVRSSFGIDSALTNILRPASVSIGEQILNRMCNESRVKRAGGLRSTTDVRNFPVKNNFHGLGYRPLDPGKVGLTRNKLSNPLMAVLGEGKRLKISGEAFGSGVLEEDEDFLGHNDAFGYDDIRNYDFKTGTAIESRSRSKSKNLSASHADDDDHNLDHLDPGLLPGFKLATDFNAMKLCDNVKYDYPLPCIAKDWKMPVRETPYIPPVKASANFDKLKLISHQSSNLFNKKFTSSIETIKSNDIETRAGLIHYSELKSVVSRGAQEETCVNKDHECTKATIKREKLEWRPCSLLCKHFNVPNPYPDNQYVGVRPSKLASQRVDLAGTELEKAAGSFNEEDPQMTQHNVHQKPASLELKRSIFGVTVENFTKLSDQQSDDKILTDSEDEPQVLEIRDKSDYLEEAARNEKESSDEDPDIIVVTAPTREPEVIVLSSSSSSSPSPSSANTRKESSSEGKLKDSEVDLYGPPLPPTLINPDHRHQRRSSSSRRRSSSEKRRKNKTHHKHHKHKR